MSKRIHEEVVLFLLLLLLLFQIGANYDQESPWLLSLFICDLQLMFQHPRFRGSNLVFKSASQHVQVPTISSNPGPDPSISFAFMLGGSSHSGYVVNNLVP